MITNFAPTQPAIRIRSVSRPRGLGVRKSRSRWGGIPLMNQPYGGWEFEVQDPSGYVLVFGELVE